MGEIACLHLILNDVVSDSRLRKDVDVIKFLLDAGQRIEVVGIFRGNGELTSELGDRVVIRRLGLNVGRGIFRKPVTLWNLFIWNVRVFFRYRQIPRSVIYVHHAELLPLAKLISWASGSVINYVPHELEFARAGQSQLKSRIITAIERWAVASVSNVVVVNASISDAYARRYEIPPPAVVENVPDLVGEPEFPVDIRAMLGLSEKQKICIYVGGFVPGRGIDSIIRWFSSSGQKEFVCVFLGDGPMKHEIEVAGRVAPVYVLPRVNSEDVVRYVAGADVGLVLIEPISRNNELALPNKFFECVMAGVPVLATPLPEVGRFIERYCVGVCINNKSAEEFFSGCRAVCDIPEAKFSAGRQEMMAEHGWEIQRRRIVGLYEGARRSIGAA